MPTFRSVYLPFPKPRVQDYRPRIFSATSCDVSGTIWIVRILLHRGSVEVIKINMNDEKLIELVRQNNALYDFENKKYSDNSFKDNIWSAIAKELDATGSACKARWYQLRDQWRKSKKNKITKSGQASQQIKKWRYDIEMSFLEPYVRQRDTVSNIEDSSTGTSQMNSSGQIENYNNSEDTAKTAQDTALISRDENESTPIKKPKIVFRKKASKVANHEVSASSELMKYLIRKQETEENRQVLKQDTTDVFFQSIAAKVKKFTPYHRNIAENKIFNLVQQLELDQILQTQGQPSAPYSQSFLMMVNRLLPQ
ncbi:uncharacterized protein [Diabrotica undecimpunctata]|uniref:uncharacterized protein n=1 Tax=Diabrotica undecimpunctata TaxID=50387 RepID=UPI003B635587